MLVKGPPEFNMLDLWLACAVLDERFETDEYKIHRK